jgi:hypothetical protein
LHINTLKMFSKPSRNPIAAGPASMKVSWRRLYNGCCGAQNLAWAKLRTLVEGARLTSKALWP